MNGMRGCRSRSRSQIYSIPCLSEEVPMYQSMNPWTSCIEWSVEWFQIQTKNVLEFLSVHARRHVSSISKSTLVTFYVNTLYSHKSAEFNTMEALKATRFHESSWLPNVTTLQVYTILGKILWSKVVKKHPNCSMFNYSTWMTKRTQRDWTMIFKWLLKLRPRTSSKSGGLNRDWVEQRTVQYGLNYQWPRYFLWQN